MEYLLASDRDNCEVLLATFKHNRSPTGDCFLTDEEVASFSSAFCPYSSNARQSSFLLETAAVNSMQQQQRRSRKWRKSMALRDFHEHAITN